MDRPGSNGKVIDLEAHGGFLGWASEGYKGRCGPLFGETVAQRRWDPKCGQQCFPPVVRQSYASTFRISIELVSELVFIHAALSTFFYKDLHLFMPCSGTHCCHSECSVDSRRSEDA